MRHNNALRFNMWQVEYTDEFEIWWNTLKIADRLYDEHLKEIRQEE